MDISVNGKGLDLSSAFRDEVIRRVESALDRFRARIQKVNVFVEDVNGPKKGVDKSLRLVVQITRLPEVVVERKGETWRTILDETIHRAAHSVSRQIGRLRSRNHRTRTNSRSSEGELGNEADYRI